ncbi:YlmH/Sll1252 family protein [Clostridium subterminale]|uniref:YlmH/Sll1252 family protein n=1 Tax=Clostridium subterminale TaxID=1550 RepID=A0ABN1KI06_CLOSU
MDKKTFLDIFKDHDKNYISSIYEDIELCKNIEMPIYTKEFVTPDIYMNIKNNQGKLGVFVHGTGVFEDSERKMICFSINAYETLDYDIHVIKIKNKSKFKELKHKDYLGSIMALGVKRSLFGDLVVKGDACFVPMASSVSQYVQDNLTAIGSCPCSIDRVNINSEDIPKIEFEEKIIIVTSLRLDNVIPSICNMSRAKGTDLISNGSVLLNYLICNRKDKLIEMKDTITIRGFGKYKVNSIEGETSKGRIKLLIGKYV